MVKVTNWVLVFLMLFAVPVITVEAAVIGDWTYFKDLVQ